MNKLTHFLNSITPNQAKEITDLNEYSAKFGLVLSVDEAKTLVEAKKDSLSSNGRVEFGNTISSRLVREFCSSPYLEKHTYLQTLIDLQEYFYHFKNLIESKISDDDLLEVMHLIFDEAAHGSVDFFASIDAETLLKISDTGDFRFTDMHNSLDWLEGWETWK